MSSFILKAVGWLAENFLGSLVAKATENAVQQFLAQRGDQDDLNSLQSSLQNARIIVNTIENMRIKDENVEKRLKELVLQLKDAAYDADDLLDEFQYRLMQQQIEQQGNEASNITSSSSSSSFCSSVPPSKKIKTSVLSSVSSRIFGGDDDDAIRVREIKGRLDRITTDIKEVPNFIDAAVDGTKQIFSLESRRTSSILVETQVFGRDKELSELMELLKSVDGSKLSNQSVSVLTIVGIGGVGKTTLAQQAYNDKRVEEHFQLKAWVSVSENFSVERLTKEIIESATRQKCDLMSFDALQMVLKEKIASRRFLLVLDDVWNEDKHKWESLCSPLRSGVPGSKILVTTRSTKIAKMVGNEDAIHLDVLDEENSWIFFRKCAFGSQNCCDHPQLEAIAKEIVPKLKGLPLAARTIGGLLSAKMDVKHWETIKKSEIWKLPQDDNGVLPVLQLSYQFLPTQLKKCFAFCSLFPKDYIFDERMLIEIWMAEGFVVDEGSVRMEDVGANYFHDLVNRSFFHGLQGGRYVMHDLIHDLAELISAGESYRIDVGKSPEVPNMLRHLSIYSVEEMEPRNLTELLGYSKLWTLKLHGKHRGIFASCMLSFELSQILKSIHVLILDCCAMKELPESIGSLIHLRYLKITSNLDIQRLPESICGLYNLQTLILTDCYNLRSLPQGMSKLINLRRLDTDLEIISEIVEVGKLTSLQELAVFKVSKEHGHKLAELSRLTQLHGRLRIMNLENVESKEEASNAKLKGKKYLDELVLEWSPVTVSNIEKNDLSIFEEVLEGLQPHHTIKCLAIEDYNGARPPSWLDAKALSNLETLRLRNCKRWEDILLIHQLPHLKCLHLKGMPIEKQINHDLFGPAPTKCRFFSRLEELVLEDLPLLEELPNLGQIPFLRVLHIERMPTVKRIEHDFYGFTDQGKCFPKLEKLTFRNMLALEEWYWAEGKELFPCLSELEMLQCPQVKRLPPLATSLTRLSLHDVGLIELPILHEEIGQSSSRIAVSLSNLYISHCPNLVSLEQGFLSYHLPNIKSIIIQGCTELLRMPVKRFRELTTLEWLNIKNCPKLRCSTQDEDLHLPPSIKDLTLSNCGDLIISLPGCLHNLTSLIDLDLGFCPNLVALPIRPLVHLRRLLLWDCNELMSIDGLCVKSLSKLVIKRCPKLALLLFEREEQRENSLLLQLEVDDTALLKLLQLKDMLPSVRSLRISSSSQEVIFEGEEQGLLLSLTALKSLTFLFCKNLQSLPAQLVTLPSLEHLSIYECPHIESLPEKGLPMSLTRLDFWGCHPKLTEQLEKQVAEMNSSGRWSDRLAFRVMEDI